ncbi:hypothetical protein HID58_035957 [Brassica napus]|uniref:Uncharacterized protein n=1 Tax=Brassica napus TaxID=3708 RepID=A0ABQ8C8F0_BRANA|nr:hypothetical protein HID58_035957 [Brassica napus]
MAIDCLEPIKLGYVISLSGGNRNYEKRIIEAFSTVQDINSFAAEDHFSFHYAPRNQSSRCC